MRGFFLPEESDTEAEKDRDILARTSWGEARGESLAGQIAMAWTIRNRVNDGKARSWWGEGRCVPKALPVQLLEQERSEFRLPEWLSRRHLGFYSGPFIRPPTR